LIIPRRKMKNLLITALFLLLSPIFSYPIQAANNTKGQIALTFDDGPNSKILKELLPLLQKYNAKVTFFVIGGVAIGKKEWLKREIAEGHEIENHSWGHDNFKKMFKTGGSERIKIDILKTEKIILEITGRKSRFFRPPFWEVNKEIQKIVEGLGYKVMKLEKPDINTMDYDDASKYKSSDILTERVKRIIAKRESRGVLNHILVFHELPITVKSLKTLMPYFQKQGYQFVRLDKIFSLP
jgi:peptidoglycan-N-acetylglucosamine deacetylase